MNEKLKQAYAYLNLPEDITREELDKRFNLLLKRQRANSADGSYEEEFQMYKSILDELDQQEIKEAEEQRMAKWGRQANVARSMENFFRLYRIHTLVSVIVLIVLVWGGNGLYKYNQEQKYLASLPPVDAKIMFLGNYGLQDPEGNYDDLNNKLVKQFPDWKRVETSVVNLPSTGNSADTLDITYMQRAMVELSSNKPDIIVMDEATLAWIGQQTGLQDLESISTDGELASDDKRLKRMKNEESGQQLVVGIDITETALRSSLPINSVTMIVGVLADDDIKEKAMDFIVQALKGTVIQ